MSTSCFELINERHIATLDLNIQAYRHQRTGAMHYHLGNQQNENVFMVAFRTLPEDSTGVAHILEHTALCGSQRFPVRDPFFMMIRRSMNTFMNAFTSSDWTAYPFATQNPKDFDHLLQVYLDAAFFARLDPLDFAQEGHRLEFSEALNPNSELTYKGIVYNEMKGSMSAINTYLWQCMSEQLFAGTTYANNSGGDPRAITKLTHEQLIEFYQRHYHPSNSIFMSCGNIPAEQHQARIETLALAQFDDAQVAPLRAANVERFTSPVRAQASYPYSDPQNDKDKSKQHYILFAWLLGQSSSLEDLLHAQLLSGVLLENSASPLQHYLETSELGSSPSALTGIDNSARELVFSCGIEGATAHSAEQFESEVIATLKKVAEEGVDQALLESALHQIELGQREVTGTGFPYGLSLMLSALPGALYDGDPIELLDIDNALVQLREAISQPNFFPQLVARLLIENQHRVCLLVSPDENLQARNDAAETAQLKTLQDALSSAQKQQLIEQAKQLEARQAQVDDASILPKLERSDIPREKPLIQASFAQPPIHFYDQPTNGLVYQDIRIPLPQLSAQQLQWLPILSSCLSEVGCGKEDYMRTQQAQSAHTGGISAFYQIQRHSAGHNIGYWGVSAKALSAKHEKMSALQHSLLTQARFDETQRLRELVQQMSASAEKSITGRGHVLAMLAASSYHSPLASLEHTLKGLSATQSIKALNASFNQDEHALVKWCTALAELYQTLNAPAEKILIIGEDSSRATYISQAQQFETTAAEHNNFELNAPTPAQHQLWLTQTQVNFCAKAYTSVPLGHPDAPALTVLASFLRDNYLHRCIREQGGAYGGGASQDNKLGLFRFYSYRDPRLADTLSDFDASIAWFINHEHSQQALDEAILTVVSGIDKPASPAGEARKAYSRLLLGVSDEQQQAFRHQLLSLTISQLKAVAERYLAKPSAASQAVISHPDLVKAEADKFDAQAFVQQQV